MTRDDLQRTLRALERSFGDMSRSDQMQTAKLLFGVTATFVEQLRRRLREEDAATKRRNAKRRETEVDPKPPVRPVTVAEPSKPKKPKYKGG